MSTTGVPTTTGTSAAASRRPPARARPAVQTSATPATAMSTPTAVRPPARTASRATAAASSTSPAAGTSGAWVEPVSTPVTGGSGAGTHGRERRPGLPAGEERQAARDGGREDGGRQLPAPVIVLTPAASRGPSAVAIADSTARALCRVSASSVAASLSATIPAPACT